MGTKPALPQLAFGQEASQPETDSVERGTLSSPSPINKPGFAVNQFVYLSSAPYRKQPLERRISYIRDCNWSDKRFVYSVVPYYMLRQRKFDFSDMAKVTVRCVAETLEEVNESDMSQFKFSTIDESQIGYVTARNETPICYDLRDDEGGKIVLPSDLKLLEIHEKAPVSPIRSTSSSPVRSNSNSTGAAEVECDIPSVVSSKLSTFESTPAAALAECETAGVELLGDKIDVLWDGGDGEDNRFFTVKVIGYSPGSKKHLLRYDEDSSEEEVDLTTVTWKRKSTTITAESAPVPSAVMLGFKCSKCKTLKATRNGRCTGCIKEIKELKFKCRTCNTPKAAARTVCKKCSGA